MSFKYEPSSKPLRISVKQLFTRSDDEVHELEDDLDGDQVDVRCVDPSNVRPAHQSICLRALNFFFFITSEPSIEWCNHL